MLCKVSVCLSVTVGYCVLTAKRVAEIPPPPDSPISFLGTKRYEILYSIAPMRALNTHDWQLIATLDKV